MACPPPRDKKVMRRGGGGWGASTGEAAPEELADEDGRTGGDDAWPRSNRAASWLVLRKTGLGLGLGLGLGDGDAEGDGPVRILMGGKGWCGGDFSSSIKRLLMVVLLTVFSCPRGVVVGVTRGGWIKSGDPALPMVLLLALSGGLW